jgi:NitT/TauT family transport system ATP-binding protein
MEQRWGLLLIAYIEEVVEMADRIHMFSSNPGHISAEVPIALPRPRDWDGAPFRRSSIRSTRC